MSGSEEMVWSVEIGSDSFYVAEAATGYPGRDVEAGIEIDAEQCDGCGGSRYVTVEPMPGAPVVRCESCGSDYGLVRRSESSVVFP